MISFQLDALQLDPFWQDEDPRARGDGTFPLVGVPGTESMGMVHFVIEPGNHLAMHTDSQDELILVLSGTAIATIGEETGQLRAGGVAFIPAMVRHGFQSVGDEPLRAVGIFPNSNVVSTFDYTLQPFGTRVLGFKSAATPA